MSASATITAAMDALVPAAAGTGNRTQQKLEANAEITALTDTIAQISIVPNDGITGDHQTFELQLCATAQSTTPDHTAEDFTTVGHGYLEAQPVQLAGTTVPAGLAFATTYYIKYVDGDTFQLAATAGGAALPFTSNGSAVTVRAFNRITLVTTYPTVGPSVPVEIRDKVNGTPDDFTKIKALQIVLRPLDTDADALGSVQLKAGDDTDRYSYFALPLHLDYTAGDAANWPSWTAALPAGFNYNTSYHLTAKVKYGESNVNLLLLINLLGN